MNSGLLPHGAGNIQHRGADSLNSLRFDELSLFTALLAFLRFAATFLAESA